MGRRERLRISSSRQRQGPFCIGPISRSGINGPEIGDSIRFSVGLDAKGRTCATNAAHVNDGGRMTALAFVALLVLLVLPLVALHRRGLDLRWSGGYLLAMSGLSYLSYAVDKRRAKEGAWRVSESGLHLTELLGGWPGAFVAQRRLRHKLL